jgi:IS30 family transposase
MTEIFTTKKLEKIIKKRVENKTFNIENIFGKWNASVFFIAKKKCLIFVNSKSFYSFIIPKFSTTQLDNIHLFFLENFYAQLDFEKIEIDAEFLVNQVGDLKFYATDNDRKINGIINYNISKIDYLKYEYEIFNASVIRELTKKLNLTPFKQLGWKNPQEVMNQIIKKANT